MANLILGFYIFVDFLFLVSGAIIMGFSLIVQANKDEQPFEGRQAARNLIYQSFPFQAGIANAVMIFIAFAITLPGIITPMRGWLKISGWFVTICGLFTLSIGVFLWVLTLRTQDLFRDIWLSSPPEVQSLMQESFQCCGYFNSTSPAFVTSNVCPSPAAAALQRGCLGPVSSFANVFLDNIFTAVFGFVGIDALLVISVTMVLKERKERERFRHIDEKAGYRTF
ncbi:tetraspanin [Plectosphaerella plurivora]|uniref:Tetraspanin n=1 Tax=Plectosphaerella plurivora TaxID=936078 RepID=A0A9P9AHD5_9PEZI|nr:tetraspanin [Plectosphaerella plurivora]